MVLLCLWTMASQGVEEEQGGGKLKGDKLGWRAMLLFMGHTDPLIKPVDFCGYFLSLGDVGGPHRSSTWFWSMQVHLGKQPSWLQHYLKRNMSVCLCVGREGEALSPFQGSHLFIRCALGYSLCECVYRHAYEIFSAFLYFQTAHSRDADGTGC